MVLHLHGKATVAWLKFSAVIGFTSTLHLHKNIGLNWYKTLFVVVQTKTFI
jgi:predicted transcriptional regulator of viral defense system